MNWHAVTTRPNSEAKAAADLRREDLCVWFPRKAEIVNRKRRDGTVVKYRAERPHYARYLFICAPSTRLWLAKRHKCQVVCFGDDPPLPAIIPNAIMEVLQAGFDATGLALAKAEVARARFRALQQVRFNDNSALKDALAKVVGDDGGEQIRVLLNILGSEREIRVPADSLETA